MVVRSWTDRFELCPGPQVRRRCPARRTTRRGVRKWGIGQDETTVGPILNPVAGLEKLPRKAPGLGIDDGNHLARSSAAPHDNDEAPGEVRTTPPTFA